ncbi:MAG TPA: MFS transporter [Thermoanaerobaculia bacterium]|jgi:MFS family permease|nr:MFS transporter [Thermoanaerobaculia bacterium]
MQSLTENLKSLPRPAWILFGGTFINRFGTFVMPFLAIYMTRNGFTPAQAGLAVSSYGAGHIIASMVGGHLADRIGRRYTIALSMFFSAGSMLALSQARTFPNILLFSFIVGMVGELYRPAATALLGDLVPAEQRVAAFGMYRFAINLGFAAGPATAGFLANKSFFYVFAGDAVTSFVYGIVALVALPHGNRSSGEGERTGEGLIVALRHRAFVYFLAGTLCMAWVEFQFHSTFPLHVAKLGYSPSTYGMLLSINGVLIVLFELAITAWTQRLPPQPLIALGYALTGIGFAITGLAAGIPMLVAMIVVTTVGEMIFAPVTGAYVSGLAPERYRGRYMGLWHAMFSFGMVLGPAMGTWIYQRNPTALWWTCFALGIAAGALALVKPRQRET